MQVCNLQSVAILRPVAVIGQLTSLHVYVSCCQVALSCGGSPGRRGDMGLGLGALLKSGGLSVSDYDAIVSINIFIALLCSCIVIGHLLEGNRWVNESITALVMVGPRSPGVCGFASVGTGLSVCLVSCRASSREA